MISHLSSAIIKLIGGGALDANNPLRPLATGGDGKCNKAPQIAGKPNRRGLSGFMTHYVVRPFQLRISTESATRSCLATDK